MIEIARTEFAAELEQCDSRLLAVLLAAAGFLCQRGKTMRVTCLIRTPARQAEIHARAMELGHKEPVRSPHEDGRAADISIRGLGEKNIAELVAYINRRFPYQGNSRYKTALRHDVGQGDHIHFQVAPPRQPWGLVYPKAD